MSDKESQLLLFKEKKSALFKSLAVSIEGRIITTFEEIVQITFISKYGI